MAKTSPFPKSREEARVGMTTNEIRLPMLVSTLAGPAMNRLAAQPNKPSISRRVANRVGEKITRRSSRTERVIGKDQREQIAKIYAETGYWHGTGRFQYREDGSVVDVLKEALSRGLQPNYDPFDPIAGPMRSISLARARMYSRAYADMHGRGEKENERHGSSLFWGMYFMGSCAVSGALEMKVHTKRGREQIRSMSQKVGETPMHWWDKVHSSMWGLMSPLKHGSDIEGNYPILIGLREDAVEPTNTAEALGIHEVRTAQMLDTSAFTHLEVPEANIAITQAMLAELNLELPVIAIEDAEAYAASRPFLELVEPVSA